MNKRIYISGPITNNKNYESQFAEAASYLLSAGYVPVNPALMARVVPYDATYEEIMNLDLCLLDLCDSIYMLHGWQESKGAMLEYGYAQAKDKLIFKEDEKTL